MKKIKKLAIGLPLILSLILLNTPFPIPTVQAASLTALSDTLSSLKISTLSSHTIKFTTPTGVNEAIDTIIITFPADFNFTSKTIGTVTFTHGATTGAENAEVLAASPSATDWGAVFSGTENRVLTLTAPNDGIGTAEVFANDKVILTYDSTNAINATSAASYTITIAGAFGDTGNILVNILNDDTVAVSATVAEILTFSISDNSIGFGTLSSSAPQYATGDTTGSGSEVEAHTLIAGTNATSGYTMTVKGATLTSGGNTITAIGGTNTASSAGSEQFGLRMTASGGTGAVSVPYAAAGFAYAADGSTTDEVASAAGATADTTYSARYIANIAAITEAGSYTANLIYVASANF